MKKLTTIVFIILLLIAPQTIGATMTWQQIKEICYTQTGCNDIKIGDASYVDLDHYPIETSIAFQNMMNSPRDYVTNLFDCEDIAATARVNFILSMARNLALKNVRSGLPVGTMGLYNDVTDVAHGTSIIIYNRQIIMIDVGWICIWNMTDIINKGYVVTEIKFY